MLISYILVFSTCHIEKDLFIRKIYLHENLSNWISNPNLVSEKY